MGLVSMWIESLDYEYEILETCTRHLSPRSKCSKCMEACELDAISIKRGVPSIKGEACIQCGKCISACSVQAVAGIFPKRTIIQNHLVITNDEKPPTTKELLIYYKKGIKSVVSEQDIGKDWQTSLNEANSILLKLGEKSFSVKVEKVDRGMEVLSRRDLFFTWRKDAQGFVKQMAPAKWRFNQEDLELARYYPNHQFAAITFNSEKCTLCSACQVLCPKNCLEITETQFSINAQPCTTCGLCEDICPEQAISVREKISLYEIQHYKVYKKICNQCKQSYNTVNQHAEKCVPCAKREGFLK